MMQKIKLYDRWGGIKPGEYKLMAENYDHNVIMWRGKQYCIPANLFEPDKRIVKYYDDEE